MGLDQIASRLLKQALLLHSASSRGEIAPLEGLEACSARPTATAFSRGQRTSPHPLQQAARPSECSSHHTKKTFPLSRELIHPLAEQADLNLTSLPPSQPAGPPSAKERASLSFLAPLKDARDGIEKVYSDTFSAPRRALCPFSHPSLAISSLPLSLPSSLLAQAQALTGQTARELVEEPLISSERRRSKREEERGGKGEVTHENRGREDALVVASI